MAKSEVSFVILIDEQIKKYENNLPSTFCSQFVQIKNKVFTEESNLGHRKMNIC